MMKEQRLDGRLTINRLFGSQGGVRFQVTDEAGQRVVDLVVTLEGFAAAIAGTGDVPCAIRRFLDPTIGMRRQHETRLVEFPASLWLEPLDHPARQEHVRRIRTAEEKQGWRAHPREFDPDRARRFPIPDHPGFVEVLFERFVDEEGRPHDDRNAPDGEGA